jgi:hypothetical protein
MKEKKLSIHYNFGTCYNPIENSGDFSKHFKEIWQLKNPTST